MDDDSVTADRMTGDRASNTVTEPEVLARKWVGAFSHAFGAGDGPALGALFLEGGYWRDALALTWELRTIAGSARIGDTLAGVRAARRIDDVRIETGSVKRLAKSWGETIEIVFAFRTDVARCRAHVRLLREGGDVWKAWTLFTSMEELTGHAERVGARRPNDPDDDAPAAQGNDDPQVLIIGAGQGGLSVAARLKALDIPAVVIDRETRIGDNWRNRYQSLLLHNKVPANHFPYLNFPANWPAYLSKEHMAQWLETYVALIGLDVRTSTGLLDAAYDEAAGRWTARVRRADGSIAEMRPRHIILATGVFGPVNRPKIAGEDQFGGVLLHANDYRGQIAKKGMRVLVVGTGSSGHDVAQDLCEAGASVTMLQRSTTCVVSVDPGAARAYAIYSEPGPPLEDADFVMNSFPFPIVVELHKDMTKRIAQMDADLLQGLRDAGFALDFGEDGTGFLMKYHRYGGGYYINVGCSDLIIAGKIKIRQGVEIERLSGHTVFFTDGTSMEVDAVVIAAGYKNMSETVRALLGGAVADKVGPVWGLDAEGEVRAMWRRTGQPGFWIMGGSLQQCRPYSKYLALQIKASEVGLI